MSDHVCYCCAKGELGCTDCCTSPFIEEDPGFWLTFSDIARIVKKTGMNPEKFCRLTELEEADEDDEEADEVYGDLIYLGDKVILMNPKNKKCSFLGKNGCKIFDARPMMCRVYPFWFKEKKGKIEITVEHEDTINEDDCYLTKSNYKNYDLKYLLSLLDETEPSFKKLIKQYIKEMKLHDKLKHQLKDKSILEVVKENKLI